MATQAQKTKPEQVTPADRAPAPVAPLIGGCLLLAGVVAIVLLRASGAVSTEVVPGLGDPGPITRWGLPLATVAVRLAAVATVGLLVGAAFLTPGLVTGDRRTDGRTVGPAGYHWLRGATWAALVWAGATVAQLVLTLSDVLGVPPGEAAGQVLYWGWSLEPTRAQLIVLAGALVIAVASRLVLTVTGAAWLAVLAVATTLPPAYTGHAASAGNHHVAVETMLLHIPAAAIWGGGLFALVLARRLPDAAQVAGRYSRAALWCFVIVGASGVINAFGQIDLDDLVTSAYGWLVLGKIAALMALGGFGVWHRRETLPALAAGRQGAFRRFAAVELLVLAATFGLAVALARSEPPATLVEEGSAQALLGYPPPAGPPTASAFLTEWLPSPLFLAAAVIAIFLYAAGVVRLRRAGTAWSGLRFAAWCGGWAMIAFATSSGLAAYAPLSFSVHMVQHLVLMTVAPILLILAAPITLALRALRRSPEPGMRGPRDWLRLALQTKVVRFFAHPVVALVFMIVSLFSLYFTGLYELALRYHLAHLLMVLHLLAAGYLFYWAVVAADPTPHRVPAPVRLLVLFAGMAFHAFFGVALMMSGTPLIADWYAALDIPWLGDPLADQRTAGAVAWSFGEIPSLVVAIAVVAQWLRSDEREAARMDRAAERAAATGDSSLDPHEQYNAYLKRLAEADKRRAEAERR